MAVGLEVPEADREVKKDPIAVQMENAVPGFAYDIDDPINYKLQVGIKDLYNQRKDVIVDEVKLS